jgi:predicted O-methyltransferase YrrM
MGQEQWGAVDRYLADLLLAPDPALEDALAAGAAAGLPAHDVSPLQGMLLEVLARAVGARAILELGTLAGYSTICLARALPDGGRLVTLEADPRFADVARANVAGAGLADVVELRVGRALDTLPALAAEGREPFDLIFIDADKRSNPEYLEWALKLSRPGTLIIADNVVRDGTVLDAASSDETVQAVRRFYELLAAEPRVTATVIQTVGVKGHDGFALALVTAA